MVDLVAEVRDYKSGVYRDFFEPPVATLSIGSVVRREKVRGYSSCFDNLGLASKHSALKN